MDTEALLGGYLHTATAIHFCCYGDIYNHANKTRLGALLHLPLNKELSRSML